MAEYAFRHLKVAVTLLFVIIGICIAGFWINACNRRDTTPEVRSPPGLYISDWEGWKDALEIRNDGAFSQRCVHPNGSILLAVGTWSLRRDRIDFTPLYVHLPDGSTQQIRFSVGYGDPPGILEFDGDRRYIYVKEGK